MRTEKNKKDHIQQRQPNPRDRGKEKRSAFITILEPNQPNLLMQNAMFKGGINQTKSGGGWGGLEGRWVMMVYEVCWQEGSQLSVRWRVHEIFACHENELN